MRRATWRNLRSSTAKKGWKIVKTIFLENSQIKSAVEQMRWRGKNCRELEKRDEKKLFDEANYKRAIEIEKKGGEKSIERKLIRSDLRVN
jgi:hypothetical protein